MSDAAKKILGRASTPDSSAVRKERRRLDGRPSSLNSAVLPNYANSRSWSQVDNGRRVSVGGGHPAGYVTPCNLPTLVLEGPPEDLGDDGQTKLKILVGGKSVSQPAPAPGSNGASPTSQRKRSSVCGSNTSSPGGSAMTPPSALMRRRESSGGGQLTTLGNTSGSFKRQNSSPSVSATGGSKEETIILALESSFESAYSGHGGSDASDELGGSLHVDRHTSGLSAGSSAQNSGSSGSMTTPGNKSQQQRLSIQQAKSPQKDDIEMQYQGPIQHEVRRKYSIIVVQPATASSSVDAAEQQQQPNQTMDLAHGFGNEDEDYPLMDLPPHFPRGGMQRLGKWTTGLCDCGSECCEPMFCGPIAGNNQHLMMTYGYQSVPSNLPGYNACVDRYCEIGGGCLVDLLCGFAWTRYRAYTVRKQVSLHFNLQRQDNCFLAMCWPCCSLSQTNRELLTRRCPPQSFCCAPGPIIIDRQGVATTAVTPRKELEGTKKNDMTDFSDTGSAGSGRGEQPRGGDPHWDSPPGRRASALFIQSTSPGHSSPVGSPGAGPHLATGGGGTSPQTGGGSSAKKYTPRRSSLASVTSQESVESRVSSMASGEVPPTTTASGGRSPPPPTAGAAVVNNTTVKTAPRTTSSAGRHASQKAMLLQSSNQNSENSQQQLSEGNPTTVTPNSQTGGAEGPGVPVKPILPRRRANSENVRKAW